MKPFKSFAFLFDKRVLTRDPKNHSIAADWYSHPVNLITQRIIQINQVRRSLPLPRRRKVHSTLLRGNAMVLWISGQYLFVKQKRSFWMVSIGFNGWEITSALMVDVFCLEWGEAVMCDCLRCRGYWVTLIKVFF